MLSRTAAAPSKQTLSRAVTAAAAVTAGQQQPQATTGTTTPASARSFATVQDGNPVKHYGGLKDQDRIFQNLYGRYPADLEERQAHGRLAQDQGDNPQGP